MGFEIKEVNSKSILKQFLTLPQKIYRGDKCWVPPLLADLKISLNPEKNPVLKKIKRRLYLLLKDKVPVGRIYVGIDTNLNLKKNIHMAFFSLFECINNQEAANLLFDAATNWAVTNGADFICGPVAITGTDGDENKGLLIDCFDRPPTIMNSYNPEYYMALIEGYGFKKDYDVFAYYVDRDMLAKKDAEKVIDYAKKRYGFRIEPLDMKNLHNEIKDLKYVIDNAMPDEWPDLVPPSLDELREMAKKLKGFADPDFIPIARHKDRPIGFGIALPDYNQALIHMKGKINPWAIVKFLWYKKRIKGIRAFVMFVLPEFRQKGVSFAIYYTGFTNMLKKGYSWGEGSTIGETNIRMRTDIEGAGAVHYKTYRIYRKII